MKVSRRIKLVVALVLWIPTLAFFGHFLFYQPLKYSYLIRRIESAKTPAEERAAFMLAIRWGCCWEVHLESPPKSWLDSRKLENVVRNPERTLAVELEWLDVKPNGVPYRAYRTLIEKSNVYVLMSK